MSNINLMSRKTICCFFGVIFFSTFGANAAVSLPAPDNAALLYYQAFLLRPELDDTFMSFDRVLRGDDPNEKVREYLNLPDSRDAIRIAEAASKILDCSWGITRPQGYNTLLPQARQLTFLLEVDARTLAVDGEYRTALERCLSIRRFARHLNDEGIMAYLISMPIDLRSLRCIHYVLGSMPPDRDTLIWLQSQVSNVQGAPPPPGRALEVSLNDDLKYLSEHPGFLEAWREDVSERIEDESTKQEILNLTYEEILERMKDSYNRYLSSVNRIIGSDIPYQQKHLELKELVDEFKNPLIIVDDPFIFLWSFLQSNIITQLDIYVGGIADFNATRAAIEIYLVKEETGQLPEVLLANLPKDPFSGQDFEYEITEDGFILRCGVKPIIKDEIQQFEFKVKK